MIDWRQAWLVTSREYLERVRSKAFLLSTIIAPLLFGGIFGGSIFYATHSENTQRVAVVAADPAEGRAVADALMSGEHPPSHVDVLTPAPELRGKLNGRVGSKELDGYLWVTTGAGDTTPRAEYASASSANLGAREQMASALERAAAERAMRVRGMSPAEIKSIFGHASVATEQVKHGQAVASDSMRSYAGAYVPAMLLYIVVLIYGMNVARSVVQEKTSRIYEVLLASAPSDSLMLGKLLGVGGAGLTQVGIWVILLALAAGSGVAASGGVHGLSSLGISPLQLVFFVLFFVLGFLFYSGVSASIGAMLGAEQELQQFSFAIVAPLMISVLTMQYVLANPSAPMSVVMSLIPPFTPITMYLRLCAQQPPMWQLVLSVVLLTASVVFVVWVAARIYRVGILMYGKRPTLPEVLRWMRAT